MNETTFGEDGVVTAMCLWEAALDMSSSESDDAGRAIKEMLGNHGVFTMRGALTALIGPCDEAWSAYQKLDHQKFDHAEQTMEAFDYDWCPHFLSRCVNDGTLDAAVEGQYRP